MSDLTDVQNALVTLMAGIAYPNGTSNPSVVGAPVRIYPGWPIPLELDADLAAGICHISVYPRPEESNSTRYTREWQEATVQTPTLTLKVAGQTVTVGGVIPPPTNPHNLVVFVNGTPFVYTALPCDTLATIARALASIAGASSSGAVITFAPNARLAVRVGVTGTAMQETRRQERLIQIGIWADSPDHRASIAKPIDAALAAQNFLIMPDDSAARLRYKSSPITDVYEKSRIFRRDLMYEVEYGTFQTATEIEFSASQLNIAGGVITPAPVIPAFS
jgi:hypothetical protein